MTCSAITAKSTHERDDMATKVRRFGFTLCTSGKAIVNPWHMVFFCYAR